MALKGLNQQIKENWNRVFFLGCYICMYPSEKQTQQYTQQTNKQTYIQTTATTTTTTQTTTKYVAQLNNIETQNRRNPPPWLCFPGIGLQRLGWMPSWLKASPKMSTSEYGVLARLLQMCDRCVWNGTCLNIFIDWLNIVHKICLKNYLLTVQLLPKKLWIIKQCSNLVEIPKLADLDWMNYPHITEIITEIITIIITIIFITIFKIREELINRAKVVQYFMKA